MNLLLRLQPRELMRNSIPCVEGISWPAQRSCLLQPLEEPVPARSPLLRCAALRCTALHSHPLPPLQTPPPQPAPPAPGNSPALVNSKLFFGAENVPVPSHKHSGPSAVSSSANGSRRGRISLIRIQQKATPSRKPGSPWPVHS